MRKLLFLAVAIAIAAPLESAAQRRRKKQEKEEITQTLEVLKDPPAAVIGDVQRLVFHVAPLSTKGLLSQQTRDGIKALSRLARGATLVKLRAFVAGTGDMRRVQAIVSEVFTERRIPIPALSVVQVGGLPMEGVQVVMESIAAAKKEVNPNGLAFISGQAATAKDPLAPIAPLVEKSLADLKTAVAAARSDPADVLRVTCFLSSLEGAINLRVQMATAFPKAALNLMQVQRGPFSAIAECEAVARLRERPAEPLVLLNPDGLPKSQNYSQIALLAPGKVALSGTQLAFRYQDSDIRLAFDRLSKALEGVKASIANTAMSSIYSLTIC